MTLEDVRYLVGLQLGQIHVQPDSRLYEDLGATSMDLVNLAVAIEDRFGVFVEEEDLGKIQTVRQLFELLKRPAS